MRLGFEAIRTGRRDSPTMRSPEPRDRVSRWGPHPVSNAARPFVLVVIASPPDVNGCPDAAGFPTPHRKLTGGIHRRAGGGEKLVSEVARSGDPATMGLGVHVTASPVGGAAASAIPSLCTPSSALPPPAAPATGRPRIVKRAQQCHVVVIDQTVVLKSPRAQVGLAISGA